MVPFLIFAALLCAAVIYLLLRSWDSSRTAIDTSNDAEWQVMAAKRDEIEADMTMDASTREEMRREWAGTADAVIARTEKTSAPAPQISRKAAAGLAFAVAFSAIGLYAATGEFGPAALAPNSTADEAALSENREPPPPEGAKHPGEEATLDERIAGLEKKLKETPNDLSGWVLLARSRAIQRDFPAASAALEKALELAPGHPDLLADLADMVAMSSNRTLAGRPTKLIQQVLQAAPDHKKGLSLAATAALQRNDMREAAIYLKRLRAVLPPESPEIDQINTVLARVEGGGLQAEAPQPGPAEPKAATGAGVEGSVELSPAIAASLKQRGLPDQAVLFIVARDPNGPPMPVAAARLPAASLLNGKPMAFKLDDASAMNPAVKISGLSTINLEARISLSGVAGRQPGDPLASLRNVKVGERKLRLVIDSTVQ